jgi:hypothetical protein
MYCARVYKEMVFCSDFTMFDRRLDICCRERERERERGKRVGGSSVKMVTQVAVPTLTTCVDVHSLMSQT